MKKKIAFISKKMDIGGIEKAALCLLEQLDQNEFEVDFFYRRRKHENIGELFRFLPNWINKYEITTLGKDNYKLICNTFLKKLNFWMQYVRSFLAKNKSVEEQYVSQALLSIIPKKQYDLAIAYDGPKAFGVFFTADRIKAKKKILWIHGDVVKENATSSLMFKIYSQFDNIITVSKEAKKIFTQAFPLLSARTCVVYNYVDDKRIRRLSLEKVQSPFKGFSGEKIVTVGRLGNDKGMMMAAQCCNLLIKNGYNVKWVICGDGPEKESIQTYINDNNLQENMILLGNQENPYPYMRMCDIYVQPSIREGYCTTTEEAKVLKKPIVTTNVCGMQEQFSDGINGLIVDISVEALYEGIKKIIEYPEIKKYFRKELDGINWEQITNYNQILMEF